MGSGFVCENGNVVGMQCFDGTSGDDGASGAEGASGDHGGFGVPVRSRAASRRGRFAKLLLTGALTAGMQDYVLALPLALLGLLDPVEATDASPSSTSPVDTFDPEGNATFPPPSEGLSIRQSCSDDGALSCGSGGSTFYLCSEGTLVDMGSVAAGTICENGVIGAAPGYDGAPGGSSSAIESAAPSDRIRGSILPLLLGGLVVGVLGPSVALPLATLGSLAAFETLAMQPAIPAVPLHQHHR